MRVFRSLGYHQYENVTNMVPRFSYLSSIFLSWHNISDIFILVIPETKGID